ncbi:sulfate transporter [Micromonospora sp. KC207]|uniref:ATP-binding protein n=1 Tax=Micromonospora sp. KC207 TaxID=2530377 RepID=UPI001042B546|nr:ATP-binding protein [Micromonospora sp. KC207]TDC61495.1 sulfate transporter [Micromonospora sp. KC207]
MVLPDRPDARFLTTTHNGSITPTDVRCVVEIDESTGVLRLTGVLDAAGTAAVRDALLVRLCDRPGPMVTDLSRLRLPDPAARGLFTGVHREIADWPAAGLLVVDPTGAAAGPGLPVCSTVAEATAALNRSPTVAATTTALPPFVGAARQARALVTDGCARWGIDELAEAGCIAVTEMVNNVVAHAHTPMTVRLAPVGSTLRIGVRDHSRRQPTHSGLTPPTLAGGRGLLLIDTVSRRWGSTLLPDGKLVWAVLHPAGNPG